MPPTLVIHVPHASTIIPPDVLGAFLISPEELAGEILRMTDWFTGELFGATPDTAISVVAPVSRLVVDVERFRHDAQEVMASRGMGAIYTRTYDGRPLRLALADAEREAWLTQWYDRHHAALTDAVSHVLKHSGRCLIIDSHSFPSAPLPFELEQVPVGRDQASIAEEFYVGRDQTSIAAQVLLRPDICLGLDPCHTPSSLREYVREYFVGLGFTVEMDRPYAGTIVPELFHRKDRRVASLMIEVNRRLYMDELSGIRSERFQELQSAISDCLNHLARFSCAE